MHRDVVDKHPGEEKREKDGGYQEPLADFVFGFCDFVHDGEIWMQGWDYKGIWQEGGDRAGKIRDMLENLLVRTKLETLFLNSRNRDQITTFND